MFDQTNNNQYNEYNPLTTKLQLRQNIPFLNNILNTEQHICSLFDIWSLRGMEENYNFHNLHRNVVHTTLIPKIGCIFQAEV